LGLLVSSLASSAERTASLESGEPQVLYVHARDEDSGRHFKKLLDSKGLATELVDLAHIEETDFSKCSLILIGSDTGRSWKGVAKAVDEHRKPILGLGEGGYSFLGELNLRIGAGHGWHGRETNLLPANPSNSPFWAAKPIDAPTDKKFTVYATSGHVGIYLPEAVSGVTTIGREVGSRTHYVLIQQEPRYMLWGFTGSPKTMTPAGKELFAHTCRYVASLADQQPQKVFESMRRHDLAALEYSERKINGSDNENNELRAGTILAARTSEGRYCKFMIQDYGYNLLIRWVTYDEDGTVHSQGSDLKIRGTWQGDLDSGRESKEGVDFWWEQVDKTERYLVPSNGAQFAILRKAKPAQAATAGAPPGPDAKVLDKREKYTPSPDPFAVPEGGMEELLKFIQDLQAFRPRSAREYQEHRTKSGPALKTAADRILSLEPDESSEAYRVAVLVQLQNRVQNMGPASLDEKKKIVGDLTDALKDNAKTGLGSSEVRLAMSAARSLEYGGETELAADAYEAFGEAVGDSEDESIAKYREQLKGAARRLRLPGNTLELRGTLLDGSELDWESYRGKVVLVDFWATWCGPCRAEMPNVKKYYELYHDRGFDVVGISLDRSREVLDKFLETEKVPWVTLYADDAGGSHPMATYYGVSAIPTVILVDKEGKTVSLRARGEELGRLLREQLGPVDKEKVQEIEERIRK
jgi:thiol-disulfide isomerase/thioredoxin